MIRKKEILPLICFIFFAGDMVAQESAWQEFESVGYSRSSRSLVNVMKDGMQYYYHLDSQLLMDEIDTHGIGMTVAMKDGAYGVVRDDGELIIPFAYDRIRMEDDYTGQWYEGIPYNYKFIHLQKDGRYGFADTNGNVLAEPKYDQLNVLNKHVIAVEQDDRWGWLDATTGDLLQSCIYEKVSRTYAFEDYIEVKQDGKYGLARKDGTLVVPIEHEKSLFFPNLVEARYIIGEKQGVYTVYDSLGTVFLQGDYPALRGIQNSHIFSFTKNKMTGLVDPQSGKVIFEPQFSAVAHCVRGLYMVVKDDKYGVVNEQGEWLLPPDFDRAEFINAEGQRKSSARIVDPGFYGKSGNTITPEREARIWYDAKIDSLPYYIRAYKDTMVGIFDWAGKPLVPLDSYNRITPHYYNGEVYFTTVHHDGSWRIRDGSGKDILQVRFPPTTHYQYNTKAIETRYDLLKRYVDIVEEGDGTGLQAHVGLFDLKTETMLIEPHTQSIEWLNKDYFKVIRRDKEYNTEVKLYDPDGKLLLNFDKDIKDVLILDNGMLLVEKREGYGDGVFILMDTAGNVIYKNPKWSTRGSFGHFRFPENKKWVRRDFHGGWKKMFTDEKNLFINEKGEEWRLSDYEQVDGFFEGYAFVAKTIVEDGEEGVRSGGGNYRFGLIDSTGKEVFPPVWHAIQPHGNDPYLIQVKKDRQYGLIDRRGEMILKPEYDYIESSANKPYVQIKKDEKLGLMTPEGRIVIEPRYDMIRTNTQGEEKTWPLLVKEGEWYYFIGKDGKSYNIRAKEYTY